MPTDLDQSTGLERLEILSKISGVDVFDMYVGTRYFGITKVISITADC